MTTPAATPGPWRVQKRRLTVYTTSDPESGTGVTNAIAAVCRADWDVGSVVPPDEADANAHLIAAAPLMRDALQADIDWWDFENAEPPYPKGMARDKKGGEAFWREWYDKCQAMCERARDLQRAALAASRGEGEP